MLKSFLAFVVLLSVAATSADAKTILLPDEDDAIATLNVPDSWEPEPIENGVAGVSPDKAVYLSVVAVGNEKGMNAEIDSTFEMLKEHKVELDVASKKENKFKINGLAAEEMLFQAKDEDGPAGVSITFVTIKDKLVILTYWVSTGQEEKNSAAMGKILNSLKPL